jgi:hypothetical protein
MQLWLQQQQQNDLSCVWHNLQTVSCALADSVAAAAAAACFALQTFQASRHLQTALKKQQQQQQQQQIML